MSKTEDKIKNIKERLDAFVNSNTSWRITLANPYTSSSWIMQEWGSDPEKVMMAFLGNATEDVQFLLDTIQNLKQKHKRQKRLLARRIK